MWIKARPSLLIALLLAWWLACWWGTGIWRDKLATQVYDDARQRTEQFFSTSIVGYERIIATRRGMIRVLAQDQTYRDALSGHSPLSAAGDEDERRRRWNADPRLAAVSRQLATAARDFGMRSIWLMDANGDCIAASNATEPRDHVGTRYADRDYFQAARAGRSAHQINIGRRQLGASISFSVPVTDQTGRVIGILAGGNDLSTFTNWLDQADAFFTDRHGVVILAKDPAMILSALPNAPAQSFDAATRQKLYKTSDIPTLSLPTQRDARFPELLRFTDGTAPVIFGSHPVTDGELILHVLQPLPQLADLGHRRAVNAGTLGLVGILLILLVAGTLRRRREQRAMALALAEREQKAMQSRDFLDQMVNAIPDPVFVKDRAHRWVLMNNAFCELVGQPREKLIGKSDFDFFPENQARVFWDKDELVFSAGIENVNEEKITGGQGDTRIIVTKKSPVTTAEGDKFLVGIISDISARKQTERLLRAREREFRTLAENLPDVVIRYDRECRRLYVNPALATMAGAPPEELLGRLPQAHTPLVDSERYLEELRRAMDGGAPCSLEVQVRRANGEPGWYLSSFVPEFDADGQVVGALVVARDITERKRIEAALAAREQEFRSLAESSPDFIVRYDRDGRPLYFNDRLLRHLGLASADEAIGKRPGEVWPDGRFAELEQAVARAMAGEDQVNIELVEPTPSGAFRFHQIFVVPERGAGGQIIGAIAFGREITAIREAERKLAHFIDNLPGLAYTFSLSPEGHGCFPYVSSAIENIYGLKPEEVKDDMAPLHALAHPDDQPRIEAAIAESMQTMRPFQIESRVCRPGQPERWIDVRSVPEHQPDGSILWYGLMLDITERKLLENALKQRETAFRALAENLPDNVIRWDVDGCYLYINPVHERTLGVSANDMIGKAIPDSHTFVKAAIAQVVATGQAATLVCQPVVVDGETQIHEVSLAPEFDDAGHVVSVLGIGRDMTDIYHMQAALAAREQEFRSLAESLPVAVIRYDSECRRRYLNRSAQRMLHGSTTELLGHVPGGGGVPASPAMIQHYQAKMEEVLATDTARELDFVLDMLPADQRAYYEVRFVPEHGADGKTRGVLAIWYDITERKLAEQTLRASEALAQSRNDLLQAIVESSPEIIVFALDTDYRYLAFNQKHKEVMQAIWGKEIAIGMNMLDVIGDHPDRKAAQHGMDRALAGESFVLEEAYGDELLSRQYWQDYWSPIRSDAGKVIGLTCFVLNISERKKAEVAVRESEEKLRSLYELSPLGIALTDMDGRYLEFNEAFRAICGYPADELKSLDYWTLTPREYEPQEAEQLQSLSLTGRYGPYEKEYLQKDGRRIPIQLNGTLVTGRDGQRHIWSIVENTTGRKQAEIALLENFNEITDLNAYLERQARELAASREQLQLTEAWYHGILRSAPDGMLVIDRHGVIVQANAQLEALFGYEERELIGRHVEMLLPSAIRDMHVKKRIDFVTSGRVDRPMSSALNLRGCRKDGSEFPVDISLSQLPDIAGRVGSICAAIRDITERKCMEDELQRGRLALKDAQRIGQIGSWEFDLVSGVLNWSDEALRMFEIAPALFGASMDAFMNAVHPEDRERVSAAYDASVKSRTVYDVEHRLLFPDGRVKDVRERGETWYDADGRPLRTLGTVQNITEAKLAEARLRKSRDIVRALAAHQETEHEKERRQLAYEIHEDLAQNLAALRLNISLFEMSDESAPRAPLLKTMRYIADRSIARIRDIVSMLRPTVLDLGLVPALRWLIDDFKGVGFQFDLALQEDILINGEVSTLLFRAAQEALLNIALHAAATHVHVSLDSIAGVCRLVVRDNGCGFDPAAPHREGRFGLVRLTEQARHLGGYLSIDSTPDQGTVLQIHLPGSAAAISTS